MATKIKLTRVGKMREPHYRVVVADARTRRDGRSIETIGEYHPKSDPSVIRIDAARAAYWLGVGAQPTEAVTAILKVTGDWQKFKGLPAPEPMKVAAAKPDKRALFDAALGRIRWRTGRRGHHAAQEGGSPQGRAGPPAAEAPAAADASPAAEAAPADGSES